MEHAIVSCVTKRKDNLSYPSIDFHLNPGIFHMNTQVTHGHIHPDSKISLTSSLVVPQYNDFIRKSHFSN